MTAKSIKTLAAVLALLLALTGSALAQGPNASATVTIDLDNETAGDQGETAVTGEVLSGDNGTIEIHAQNVTNLIAFRVKFSFDNQYFSWDKTKSTLNGAQSGEMNLLETNGGSIFQGSFLSSTTTSGTTTTVDISVTLDGSSQASNAVTGSGLLMNIYMDVIADVPSGTTASFSVPMVEFIAQGLASDMLTPSGVSATVTGNNRPSPASIISPANAAVLQITGEPADPFVVSWSISSDAEGDAVTYGWELALSSSFAPGDILLSLNTGTTRFVSLTMGQVAALLTANGVPLGGAVTLYHRALSWDNINETSVGPTNSVVLVRGAIVPTEDLELPDAFALNGNYPNPFNPTTNISFDLPESALVTVAIYDALGRQVLAVPAQQYGAGAAQVMRINAHNLKSGMYLYRVTADMVSGQITRTGRMTLLK